MPQVINNQDGTKTFTINSSELRVLRNLLVHRFPDVKKVTQLVDDPGFRATVDFIRAVVA